MATDVYQIKINGNVYNLEDAFAREQISTIKQTVAGGVQYVGATTTALSDGAATSTVEIKTGDTTESHTAAVGDMVDYNNVLFLFNKNKQWDQLGSAGALKALAYKDSVSASYTPAGSVSQPTFSGTEGSVSADYTPAGSVSQPTFAGTKATISMSGTPAGTVTQPDFTGSEGTVNVAGTPKGTVGVSAAAPASGETANYTPEGDVSVTPTTAQIQQITGVGSLPTLETTVQDGVLEINFNQGALPTRAAATVATGVKSASFEGKGTVIKGSFTGQSSNSTGKFTPAGTVSQPTFEGTELDLTASYTPAGSVTKPSFTGTAGKATGKFTPSGTVSKPSFTGTPATIESK